MVVVYCDGSAINNGKKDKSQGAGIGVFFPEYPKIGLAEPVPRKFNQTNQVAELWAINRAIDIAISQDFKELLIKSDSKYSIECLSKWCKNWEKNGWKTSGKLEVKNKNIIQDTLTKMKKIEISFKHVRGHTIEPKDEMSTEWEDWYGNDQADTMANIGTLKSLL